MPDQETIFVRAANTNRKVALSEGNSAHPLGEATVVGFPNLPDGTPDPQGIVEVAPTSLVRRKLADGDLIEVSAGDARQAQEEVKRRASADKDRPIEERENERMDRQAAEARARAGMPPLKRQKAAPAQHQPSEEREPPPPPQAPGKGR
jgi:hypothetical protein